MEKTLVEQEVLLLREHTTSVGWHERELLGARRGVVISYIHPRDAAALAGFPQAKGHTRDLGVVGTRLGFKRGWRDAGLVPKLQFVTEAKHKLAYYRVQVLIIHATGEGRIHLRTISKQTLHGRCIM